MKVINWRLVTRKLLLKYYFSYFSCNQKNIVEKTIFPIFLVRRKNPTFSISYLIFYSFWPVGFGFFGTTTINKISVHLTPALCNEVYQARCKNTRSSIIMKYDSTLRQKCLPFISRILTWHCIFWFFEGSFERLLPLQSRGIAGTCQKFIVVPSTRTVTLIHFNLLVTLCSTLGGDFTSYFLQFQQF